MRGVGVSTGAITIVNALPTGIGSAAGIELAVRAELELRPSGSSERWDVRIEPPTRTPLVIESLSESLRCFAPGSSGQGELSLASEVPVARGLKSSSAVSSAVALAVARATDASVGPTDIAAISARASIAAGVSATGAFDDALAGLTSGIVVTDNERRTRLAAIPLDPDLRVAVYIPEQTHAAAPDLHARLAREHEAGRRAAAASLRGDWVEAMRQNSELVERALGYDYAAARARLLDAGALACGVSGLGPALAAIAPSDRIASVERMLPGPTSAHRSLRFSSDGPFPREAR
ncbi:MAG TPA: shikimate kinase [Thermoplasmata archaeon]|nr:shikimate kinase [Thermoplasmata archaeon]